MNEAVEKYKEENRGTTLVEVVESIKTFVQEYGLRGNVRVNDIIDTIYVRVERAWAVGADLTINFSKKGLGWKMESCDVGWSSTKRTISEAVAAIDLYKDIVNLGGLIEAKFGKEKIVAFDDDEILERLATQKGESHAAV